jgi:hypothetical protein
MEVLHHMDLVEVQRTPAVCHMGQVVEERPAILAEVVYFPLWEVEEQIHDQLEVGGRHLRVVGGFRLSQYEEAVARQLAQAGHRKVGFERQRDWVGSL